ncbi:MAG: type IV pilus secretin PilQ [Nitrospirota bacterium]|nr:type IV pilus secretin PilQ [Nitrospirota bacterium]MDP2381748.1 type IV pilus secretin PilQ [Nitrospirota bacterium]MDP3597592.1 type IV pilus secretin PilQ [Nitrospirota bacterium]
MTTTSFVRVLSAVGALSIPVAVPSIGASTDWPAVDSRLPSSIEGALAQTLTRIDVQRGTHDIRVVISGDGRLAHEVTRLDERRLIIDIPHVASGIRQPVLSVNHQFLKQVRLGYHADKVRVVLDLAGQAGYSVEPQGASLIVTLRQDAAADSHAIALYPRDTMVETIKQEKSARLPLQVAVSARGAQRAMTAVRQSSLKYYVRPVQMTSEPDGGEKSTPKEDLVVGETRYVGRRISLDFQQADISNVLRLIAEVSGFNMVVGEGVKSKVTMKLVSVPWDQALDMILKMNGLGKIRQGNILWIDSLSNIAKQQNEEAQAKDAKTKAEDLVDRVFYIRNLQATELMTALRQYLSPRGLMQMSQGTNALIVRDTESRIGVMKQLVDGLDLEVPQVQIEARIVQADTTYSRSLGVQWGVQNVNQVGSSGVANFKTGNVGSFGNQASDFLVNLPATVGGLVATPGVGFTIGRTDGAKLDMRLSAGELLGLSKVIASPKITTLDKREAKISQGESIPFQTTSLQGTQTTFVDANLELNVTPQITSRDPKELGKTIQLKVRATRNAVGARSNPAGPSIDRREANTLVNIRDGETMVIGGVFIDSQNNSVAGIPYLSRIPLLGWLFKQKTESVAKQELLIFLTPSIVKS